MNTIGLHLLPHRATVQRKSRTADGKGGFPATYADHLTNQPCRVCAASASERTLAQQPGAVVTDVGYFLPGVDVARDDQVVGIVGPSVVGRTYRVLAQLDPSLPHHHKVALEEIQEGR